MSRTSTIELFKEDMKFSAGHFTILSPDRRENLHGHNYTVYSAFTAEIGVDGMSFDYRFYKEKLRAICRSLNEKMLIAGASEHLIIADQKPYTAVTFQGETLLFAPRDIKILPVSNVTVEELSHWILSQVRLDERELLQNKIQKIKVKVFSGPGQSGSSVWRKEHV